MNRATVLTAVNFVLFQLAWLLCVWLTGWTAVAIALLVLGFHLGVVSSCPGAELRFILLGVVLGTLLDGLWYQLGVLADSTGSRWTPPWLMAIWAIFLTTPGHSLAWMHQRVWLPFVLAPVAGPAAYYAASQMGAVILPYPAISLAVLALGWMLVFPLLMWLQRRFFKEVLS